MGYCLLLLPTHCLLLLLLIAYCYLLLVATYCLLPHIAYCYLLPIATYCLLLLYNVITIYKIVYSNIQPVYPPSPPFPPFTQSLTQSVTHSLSHSLTHSLTDRGNFRSPENPGFLSDPPPTLLKKYGTYGLLPGAIHTD